MRMMMRNVPAEILFKSHNFSSSLACQLVAVAARGRRDLNRNLCASGKCADDRWVGEGRAEDILLLDGTTVGQK